MPLRARDLVGLGLDGHRFGIPLPSRARRRLIDEMLEAVDAEHFADARVGNLSGGRAAADPDRARADQPSAAAAARRAAGQPRHRQRAGGRRAAGPDRQGAADRRADLGARDEPAAAGHGPGRLRGGGSGGQRDHRRGRHGRGAQRAVRPPRRRHPRPRPDPGGGRARRRARHPDRPLGRPRRRPTCDGHGPSAPGRLRARVLLQRTGPRGAAGRWRGRGRVRRRRHLHGDARAVVRRPRARRHRRHRRLGRLPRRDQPAVGLRGHAAWWPPGSWR